jgi:hypothetical protein
VPDLNEAEIDRAFFRRRALDPRVLGTDDAKLARRYHAQGYQDGAWALVRMTAEMGGTIHIMQRLVALLTMTEEAPNAPDPGPS